MENTIENIIKKSKLEKFYNSHQELGNQLSDAKISSETFRAMFSELISNTAKELNISTIDVIDEFMQLKSKLRLAK
jgi:hypothetical protein